MRALIGFLRSESRPQGWRLDLLLRAIRLELEVGIGPLLADGHPAAGRRMQIAGHLLAAEGLAQAEGRMLEAVRR